MNPNKLVSLNMFGTHLTSSTRSFNSLSNILFSSSNYKREIPFTDMIHNTKDNVAIQQAENYR